MSPWWIVAIVVVSMVVGGGIVLWLANWAAKEAFRSVLW